MIRCFACLLFNDPLTAHIILGAVIARFFADLPLFAFLVALNVIAFLSVLHQFQCQHCQHFLLEAVKQTHRRCHEPKSYGIFSFDIRNLHCFLAIILENKNLYLKKTRLHVKAQSTKIH